MNSLNNNARRSPLSSMGFLITLTTILATIAGLFFELVSYLAFLLAILGVVILSEEESLCFLMFMMPFATIFKAAPDAQSFFTYIVIFYVAWSFLKKQKMNKSFFLSFVTLLTFLVAQMCISINFLRMIKFLVNILLIYFAINTSRTEGNKKVYIYYIMGIALSSILPTLNVIPNLNKYVSTTLLGFAYEGVERFSGLYSDPNYYSVNVIICLCLIVVMHHNKQLKTFPAVALAVAMTTFAVMTISKSAFLMLLLPLLLLFYSKIKNRKYFIFAVAFTASFVLVLAILAGRVEAFNTILERFTAGDDISSLTTVRSDLWMQYLEFLYNSILALVFGVGFGAGNVGELAAHNTYIDLLYYLGIIGTAILIVILVKLATFNSTRAKKNILNCSVWVCILVMYFFLSQLLYYDWPFHIVIAIFVSKMDITKAQEG